MRSSCAYFGPAFSLALIIDAVVFGQATPGTDLYGDPLPEGIIARMGTVRFRHPGQIMTVVFSPDGKVIASEGAGWLDQIRIWDAATGKEMRRTFGRGLGASSFSADGKLLALDNLRLWDATTGSDRDDAPRFPDDRLRPFGPRMTCALCPDGNILVWATEKGGIHLWDRINGREQAVFGERLGPLTHRLLLVDAGKKLISTHKQAICVWDLARRTPLQTIRMPEDGKLSAVAVSPNGKFLATCPPAKDDRALTIHLWDATTGKEIRTLDGRPALIYDFVWHILAFSPDSTKLAVSHQGDTIRIWDVPSGKELEPLRGSTWMSGVAFSPDGKRIAAGDGHAIRVWDLTTRKECFACRGHVGGISSLAFSPDGTTLASADSRKAIHLWDPLTGKERRRLRVPAEGTGELAYCPDGKHLVTDGTDHSIHLWDVAAGKWLPPMKLTYEPSDFAFAPDGRMLAIRKMTGGSALALWDFQSGRKLRDLEMIGTFKPVFSPDGKWLTLGDDQGLALWDVRAGTLVRRLGPEKPHVSALAFSPDGTVLAVGDEDGALRLWDPSTGKEIRTMLPPKEEGAGSVGELTFSPDGKSLAMSRRDIVRVWEVATGGERGRFESGNFDVFLGIRFSPDGKLLAIRGNDSNILMWDVTGLLARRGQPSPRLADKDLQRLWTDLADLDARRGFQALTTLAASEQAASWLREHLRQPSRPEPERLRQLVAHLDAEQFALREQAVKELRDLGDFAAPALHETLAGSPSTEARRRIERVLSGLDPEKSPERLRALRAIEVLEHAATPETRQVLTGLAKGAAELRLTRDAKAALDRLTQSPKR